jgi:hypothetical protein
MNIYYVLSEVLSVTIPILDDGTGPEEDYAICELVAASTRSRAKWAAWKSDRDSFDGDVRDMPRFAVRLLAKGVDVPEGILPHDSEYWALAEVLDDIQHPPRAKAVRA